MNANDALRHYCCMDNYYKFTYGMLLTDGSKALADEFQCYWFLDIISSYQPQLQKEDFQVWHLKKYDDDSALVTCEDGNGKKLVSQVVDYTDSKATTATVWVEDKVILIPTEH
jgi:hypothetical protein